MSDMENTLEVEATPVPDRPPLTVRERAYEAASLHPSCTLEVRRLKKARLFEAIYRSKPGAGGFLYKGKGKSLDEALDKATQQFVAFARKTGLDAGEAEEAADVAGE